MICHTYNGFSYFVVLKYIILRDLELSVITYRMTFLENFYKFWTIIEILITVYLVYSYFFIKKKTSIRVL